MKSRLLLLPIFVYSFHATAAVSGPLVCEADDNTGAKVYDVTLKFGAVLPNTESKTGSFRKVQHQGAHVEVQASGGLQVFDTDFESIPYETRCGTLESNAQLGSFGSIHYSYANACMHFDSVFLTVAPGTPQEAQYELSCHSTLTDQN